MQKNLLQPFLFGSKQSLFIHSTRKHKWAAFNMCENHSAIKYNGDIASSLLESSERLCIDIKIWPPRYWNAHRDFSWTDVYDTKNLLTALAMFSSISILAKARRHQQYSKKVKTTYKKYLELSLRILNMWVMSLQHCKT